MSDRLIRQPAFDPRIVRQLDAQDWRCAYDGCRRGGKILPGDALAVAYDNHHLIHLTCAHIGNAPSRV